MGNSYVSTFITGTIFGATSLYLLYRFRHRIKVPQSEQFKFPNLTDEYRLVLGVRNDLKMQKGKVAAQCGHAAVAAYAMAQKAEPHLLKHWMRYGGTKITVRIDSEEELLELDKRARSMGVLTSVIRDAGQTQVAPGTRTVIAVGPAPKSLLQELTGHLKLY